MASAEDVGAKRQMFYEIECVIEDCDNDVGYKPLSDSDDVDDSAEEDELREEDIDSSEEWEPLGRSKLKRHASSSPSSSLPRRRGRPPKNALKTSPTAPVMGNNMPNRTPKTTPALPRRRGRPPKDKTKLKLIPKASPYPTIVPKPPPFATLIPNTSANAQAIKFGPNSTSTITLGPNFSPITLSSPTSSIKLSPNSTPILIPNAASTFKLSPNSGSTSASIATLICTPTSTGILLDGNMKETETVKEEKVDREEQKFKKDEIPERSDSPDIKRQRLSSPFAPDGSALGRGGSSETQPTAELSFQSEETTMDDQLTSILASEPTPILNHKHTSDPNSRPPIHAQEDSDFNSDLDGDSDEISDSGREEELWEDDVDTGEDWNHLLESPERSKSPASAPLLWRGKDRPPTASSPQEKPNTLSSPQEKPNTTSSPQGRPTTPSSPQGKPPISTSEHAPEAIPTPTSEATNSQPTPEATPTVPHNSTHGTTPIPSPVPTIRRRRGRPRKNPLNSTLTPNPTLELTPTPILSPTPAADSTPTTNSDPTLVSSSGSVPNPTSSTKLEANSEPASSTEAIPQSSSNEDKLKPAASSCSPRETKSRLSFQSDLPWTEIGNMPEKWLNVSDEDVKPELLNFAPKRPPGLQLWKDATYTPLQLFQLFFTSSTIKTIVQNTNSNAEKRAKAGKKFTWVPLTVAEFYSYLAIVVYMSLVKAKTIVDYWARKRLYNFSFPQSVITRARFMAITWNLHFCDPKEDEENNKMKGTTGYDRLLKIKPLYLDILLACRKHFHPHREIIVDERIDASKARIGPKRFMNDPPEKWGYKLFVLVDSSCGYTWNLFVYEGKTWMSTGKGIGYDSVMRVIDHNYLGRGYRLYTDVVYTSPTLFLDLWQKNIFACGNLRNTLSLPKINDLSGRSERGSIRWCRQGPLLFVKWMDAKEVLMCSTIHKAFTGDTVLRKTKDGTWKVISVPSAVKDYSKYMGVVTLSDSLMEHYDVLKTTKWYKTFFYHFLDIAVVNSFVLHQQLAKAQKKTPLTPKLFRETLVSELTRAGRGINPSAPAANDPSTSATKKSKNNPAPSSPVDSLSEAELSPPASPAQTEQCFPEYIGSNATSGRKVCVMCKLQGNKVKTPIYCTRCKVALCFVSTRNCFKKWHNDGHPGYL